MKQFAVPLLDHFFKQPVLKTSDLFAAKGMPSRPMLHNLLGRLKEASVLKSVREGRGRRAEIVALPQSFLGTVVITSLSGPFSVVGLSTVGSVLIGQPAAIY